MEGLFDHSPVRQAPADQRQPWSEVRIPKRGAPEYDLDVVCERSPFMSQPLCQRFGFEAETIAERLRLLGLSEPHSLELAHDLQNHVIRPNVDAIIDDFYEMLGENREFAEIVRRNTELSKLKMTQRRYLLSLADNFESSQYFEERLRIGVVHQHVGVSLSLYHSSYRLMKSLLIDNIPEELSSNPSTFKTMVQFIIKIVALDMSLAIEAYCIDRVGSLQKSIDTMRGEGEALRRILRIDSLTKLCTRAFSIQVLKAALSISHETHRPLCVVMADLDHFKKINDTYGHLFGDKILAAVAARMSSDARDRDTIGRYGGEEFIIILEDTDLAKAEILAERIRKRVSSDPIGIGGVAVVTTLSLGIAEVNDDDDAESVVARADRALYAAKSAGRNRVAVAEAERA
jgi:diguanylate cyclase (GGDEF)-like protein